MMFGWPDVQPSDHVEHVGAARKLLARILRRRRRFVTASGRVLTDADIQELADEAERGYDPDSFTPLSEAEAERLGIGQDRSR